VRWILLTVGACTLAIYGYVGAQIVGIWKSNDLDGVGREFALFTVALVWPKCILGFYLACWLIGWAIRDWHGNAHRMLLLRLLEAQQKEEVGRS
jgi:hypothetical protein